MRPDQLTVNRQLRRGGFGKYYESTSDDEMSEEPIEWYSITFKEPRQDRPEIIALLKTITRGTFTRQHNLTDLYKMYANYTSTFILSDILDYYEDHTRI